MPKKLAVLGDGTTNGKVVTATANFFSEGKQVVQNNDSATCSVCKGIFPIQGTAQCFISGGTILVQDQDRVLCGCSEHRVQASSQLFTG